MEGDMAGFPLRREEEEEEAGAAEAEEEADTNTEESGEMSREMEDKPEGAEDKAAHRSGGALEARRCLNVHCAPSKKFFSKAWPCSVAMLSGWNCTPWMGSATWRRPMTRPSTVSAATIRSLGMVARSTISEW